jgi:Holliday junction resolvase RusA-like endonuclease
MASVSFTVYGRPEPSGSKKGYVRGGVAIIVDANPKSAPWKQQVAGAAIAIMGATPMFLGPVAAEFTFYRRRPINHLRADGRVKESAPKHVVTSPDVLKQSRAVEDALSGIVYKDDSQIVDEVLHKRFGEPERVEITVSEIL